MRYIETVKDSHQHERYVIQTKRAELSILSALLAHAHRHTPPHESTEQFRNQVRGMMRTIDKIIKPFTTTTHQPTHES